MNVSKSQDTPELEVNQPKDIVILGEIVSVFGVKGYCKINSFTDPKSNIVKYFKSGVSFFWCGKKSIDGFDISQNWSQMPLVDLKAHGESKVIAKIENCNDRDLADKFRGVQIAVHRDDLPTENLDDGEFFWHDLESLDVFNEEGEILGCVSHLLATGANDVLVVKNSEKNKEYLIPFIYDQYILKVDYDNNNLDNIAGEYAGDKKQLNRLDFRFCLCLNLH